MLNQCSRRGGKQVPGSGWRKQRRGAPLVNTFRSWCDSKGVPAVYIHKSDSGADEVVVDLSPLRLPLHFAQLSILCATAYPGCVLEALEGSPEGPVSLEHSEASDDEEPMLVASSGLDVTADASLMRSYITEPIHRLPMYTSFWERPRSEAKALAKALGVSFGVPEAAGKAGGGSGDRGMPNVKAGKNRRHGGFGIGGKAKKERRETSQKGAAGEGDLEEDEAVYFGAE